MKEFEHLGGYQWVLDLPKSEQLRVICTCDPCPEGRLSHVSASVGVKFQEGATRTPTDEEFELVKSFFVKKLNCKFQEEPNQGVNPYVRHWWEIKQ